METTVVRTAATVADTTKEAADTVIEVKSEE